MSERYTLKGTLGAGNIPIPLEEPITAENDEDAIRIAQEKADGYHAGEGYTVTLRVFNQSGKEIGFVGAPKAGTPRMCEECRRKGQSVPARYREVYRDLTGTDTCEAHLLSWKGREEWSRNGDLEKVYDYSLGKEVSPITLQPY